MWDVDFSLVCSVCDTARTLKDFDLVGAGGSVGWETGTERGAWLEADTRRTGRWVREWGTSAGLCAENVASV